MSKLKNLALERPVLFSVAAILLSIILTEIPLWPLLEPYFGLKTAFYLTVILEQGLFGLLIFWLLRRFGWWNSAGITPPGKWRALWLSWPLWLMTAFFAVDFFSSSDVIDTSQPLILTLHVLAALSTGWIEELLLRGLILTAYLKKWGRTLSGIYRSVVFSSVLFGLMHLVNFFAGRKPLINNLSQIVISLFFGVFVAACLLRNRSIWPAIFLHAALDWAATLQEVAVGGQLRLPGMVAEMTVMNVLVSALLFLPLFLYGLFILRKVSPADLEETLLEDRLDYKPLIAIPQE
jgi:uncharacterized protein